MDPETPDLALETLIDSDASAFLRATRPPTGERPPIAPAAAPKDTKTKAEPVAEPEPSNNKRLVMLVVTLVLSLLTGPFMGAEPSRDEEVLLVSTLIGVAGFAAVPVGAFVMTTMTLFYLRERKGSGIA